MKKIIILLLILVVSNLYSYTELVVKKTISRSAISNSNEYYIFDKKSNIIRRISGLNHRSVIFKSSDSRVLVWSRDVTKKWRVVYNNYKFYLNTGSKIDDYVKFANLYNSLVDYYNSVEDSLIELKDSEYYDKYYKYYFDDEYNKLVGQVFIDNVYQCYISQHGSFTHYCETDDNLILFSPYFCEIPIIGVRDTDKGNISSESVSVPKSNTGGGTMNQAMKNAYRSGGFKGF